MNPVLLDTLAFAAISEQEMRERALSSRPDCDLWESDRSFVRRRVVQGPSGAPALIFLPDGPATIESYDGLIETLRDRFEIAVVEIPGFGFSFPKTADALDFDVTADILSEAIAALDLDRAVLVGPCVQGLIAARIAELIPDRLGGLIIAQTGDFAAERRWVGETLDKQSLLAKPYVGQVAFRLGREASTIDWWLPYAAGPNLPLDAIKQEARRVLRAGCCYALASQVQQWLSIDGDRTLAPQVPTAIIWGLADRSHRMTDLQSIRRFAPEAHYIESEGLGHFPDLEDPELFARTALELLSSQ